MGQITKEIISPIKVYEVDEGIEVDFDYIDIWKKINNYRSKNLRVPDNIVIEMPKRCKLFGIPVIFKTED